MARRVIWQKILSLLGRPFTATAPLTKATAHLAFPTHGCSCGCHHLCLIFISMTIPAGGAWIGHIRGIGVKLRGFGGHQTKGPRLFDSHPSPPAGGQPPVMVSVPNLWHRGRGIAQGRATAQVAPSGWRLQGPERLHPLLGVRRIQGGSKGSGPSPAPYHLEG